MPEGTSASIGQKQLHDREAHLLHPTFAGTSASAHDVWLTSAADVRSGCKFTKGHLCPHLVAPAPTGDLSLPRCGLALGQAGFQPHWRSSCYSLTVTRGLPLGKLCQAVA
jgi:hypothetical protein